MSSISLTGVIWNWMVALRTKVTKLILYTLHTCIWNSHRWVCVCLGTTDACRGSVALGPILVNAGWYTCCWLPDTVHYPMQNPHSPPGTCHILLHVLSVSVKIEGNLAINDSLLWKPVWILKIDLFPSYLSVVLYQVQWAACVKPQWCNWTISNVLKYLAKDEGLTLSMTNLLATGADKLTELFCEDDDVITVSSDGIHGGFQFFLSVFFFMKETFCKSFDIFRFCHYFFKRLWNLGVNIPVPDSHRVWVHILTARNTQCKPARISSGTVTQLAVDNRCNEALIIWDMVKKQGWVSVNCTGDRSLGPSWSWNGDTRVLERKVSPLLTIKHKFWKM